MADKVSWFGEGKKKSKEVVSGIGGGFVGLGKLVCVGIGLGIGLGAIRGFSGGD